MSSDKPIPIVRAFLVCDLIVAEQGTGKKTLIGVFDEITSKKFPSAIQRLSVYVRTVDAVGNNRFNLKLVHLDTDTMVGESGLAGDAGPDPLGGVDLTWNIPVLTLPGPGTYEFQLFANDIWIGRTTLTAKKL